MNPTTTPAANTGSPPVAIHLAALETLKTALEGAVLHITLHRPEVRNAMSLRMVTELRAVLCDAESGGVVRVIVLRGAGGHFCAGGDLKDMASARMRSATRDEPSAHSSGAPVADSVADPVAQVSAQFGELCVAFASTPLAVVAVLEGTVMGGGFGLACVADVALASDTAVFRLPETSLGVVPAQIAPFLVERLGYSQANRLAVTGGHLRANEALALGLVHAVHDDASMSSALALVLGNILACAPEALAATKALIGKARLTPPADLIQEAAAVFSKAAQGPEGQEGIAAFLQKRKPKWAPA
jgi:isohexenylglutaconyl-CoA hydratase